MAVPMPLFAENSDLLRAVQSTHKTYDLAGFPSLTDGSLYLMIMGGFSGELFEFADLNKNERTSLAIGESLPGGDKLIRKRLLLPLNDAFRDPSLTELRTSIRKLIAAKLPAEVNHVSGDDSLVILVAEMQRGKLVYWAREDAGDAKLEPEFLELIGKSRATQKLVPGGERTVPTVEPTKPVPPPAMPTGGPSDERTVKAMQASIRSGNIKEFTYGQVIEWRASGEEQVGAATYQSGFVDYKTDTIFGEKTFRAKALIKNGEVSQWVWPENGKEIK